MGLYVIILLIQNNVTKMTINYGFINCDKNDKRHIIHIHIKCAIIIIVQYIFAENVPFVVRFHKSYNEKILNTYPRDIDCIIANNPPRIVYEHII